MIPIKAGDIASCGHPATGSPNVFINGKGVTRVGLDTAGSIIQGPGNPTVLVNSLPISVVGDAIAGHGEPPHSGPATLSQGSTVFV
jgi:uncharacterized Zn-binding protein involved in type VI secretion